MVKKATIIKEIVTEIIGPLYWHCEAFSDSSRISKEKAVRFCGSEDGNDSKNLD